MPELHLYDVLLRPVVTEKTNKWGAEDQVEKRYAFEVDPRANKQQIREAVEVIFEVKVKKVNVMIMPAKRGLRGRKHYIRSAQWKKAIVTLLPGESISLFGGV